MLKDFLTTGEHPCFFEVDRCVFVFSCLVYSFIAGSSVYLIPVDVFFIVGVITSSLDSHIESLRQERSPTITERLSNIFGSSLSSPYASVARKYFHCWRQMLPLRGSVIARINWYRFHETSLQYNMKCHVYICKELYAVSCFHVARFLPAWFLR